MNSRPGKIGAFKEVGVRLDLRRHCIQTACRRHYNRAVGAYFSDPETGEGLAGKIELLRRALERIDFGALRQDHEPLRGGFSGAVRLEPQAPSGFRITIDGTTVPVPCKEGPTPAKDAE